MLRIYICPKCYNFRMVSRKPDAVCFHCGSTLEKSELEYVEFMNMTEEERNTYKQSYKNRMQLYHDKIEQMLQEQSLNK